LTNVNIWHFSLVLSTTIRWVLPGNCSELDFFNVTFLVTSEVLGAQAGLLGENVFEEFSDLLEFRKSASEVVRAISIFVLDSNILEEILKDLHVFRWITDLNERPDENGVIVHLHYVIASVHIDLYLVLLELLELILLDVIGEGSLCASKVATQDQKLVLTSLM
jgi:hypothetical protein